MERFAALIHRLAGFGLLAIVALSPTQYGFEIARRTYVSIADPLVWGVLVLWLAGRVLSPARGRPVLPPLMVWLFIGIAAVSGVRALHPAKSAKDVFQAMEYFVVVFMLFANAAEAAQRRRLLNAFLVMASVVLAVGAVQYLSPSVPDFKVRATFENRNVLGGYLSLVVPLMAGLALYEPCPWRRLWLGAAALAGLLLTLSGGAMIAMGVGLGLVSMLRGRLAFGAWAAVLVLLVVLVLPRLPRQNDAVLSESIRLFNDNNEVSLRYTEWQAAGVMLAENPLLGVGIGNYQDHIGGYFGVLPRPTGVVEHDSENLYLVIASSMGWPGLACFAGLLLTFGIAALRRFFTAQDDADRGLALGLAGAILSFSICCIWSPLLVRGIGVQLAILLAWAWCLNRSGPERGRA